MKKKMPCLAVDNAGFLSMYGIWMLFAVLTFLSLFLMRMKTYTQFAKQEQLLDVYILHTVTEELKNREVENELQAEIKDEESNHRESNDEDIEKEETPSTSDSLDEEESIMERSYNGCTISFHWNKQEVQAQSNCLSYPMRIVLDDSSTGIRCYAYEDGKGEDCLQE